MLKNIAHPPDRIEMTRERLWFLYQIAGFTTDELEKITSWTILEINNGLDRWDLRAFISRSYQETRKIVSRSALVAFYAKSLPDDTRSSSIESAFQEQLRQHIFGKEVNWSFIDKLLTTVDLDKLLPATSKKSSNTKL